MLVDDAELLGEQGTLLAYQVYGVRLWSQWRLPCPEGTEIGLREIELLEGTCDSFAEAHAILDGSLDTEKWFHSMPLADGSLYLRWAGLFEFLIAPDGRQVAGHSLRSAGRSSFLTYLLGPVLSFALVKQGIEPLHATVLVVDGSAVGILGDSGYGKSSLAAAFLQSGHRLLTDDLLVLREGPAGLLAYPGPPRIKLFPEAAKATLGEVAGSPMNPLTPKLIIPLDRERLSPDAVALRAFYVLGSPARLSRAKRITIRTLRQRQASLKLISNTFNRVLQDPDRLARQLRHASRIAARVPIKALSYPRDLSQLPAVVEAIRSDLSRQTIESLR